MASRKIDATCELECEYSGLLAKIVLVAVEGKSCIFPFVFNDLMYFDVQEASSRVRVEGTYLQRLCRSARLHHSRC
jgi:hypothetical protein